jgi:hypothetical protein
MFAADGRIVFCICLSLLAAAVGAVKRSACAGAVAPVPFGLLLCAMFAWSPTPPSDSLKDAILQGALWDIVCLIIPPVLIGSAAGALPRPWSSLTVGGCLVGALGGGVFAILAAIVPSVQKDLLAVGIYLFVSGSVAGLSGSVGALKARAWAGAATGAILGLAVCGLHVWGNLLPGTASYNLLVWNIVDLTYFIVVPALIGNAGGALTDKQPGPWSSGMKVLIGLGGGATGGYFLGWLIVSVLGLFAAILSRLPNLFLPQQWFGLGVARLLACSFALAGAFIGFRTALAEVRKSRTRRESATALSLESHPSSLPPSSDAGSQA